MSTQDEWGFGTVNPEEFTTVSTILQILDSGLLEWYKRVGPAEAEKQIKEGSTIGTFIHENLDRLAKGESPTPPSHVGVTSATAGLQKWLQDTGSTIKYSKVLCYNVEYQYKGEADCIVQYHGKDELLYVVEIKTSRRVRRDAHMQLAAYVNCTHFRTITTRDGTNTKDGPEEILDEFGRDRIKGGVLLHLHRLGGGYTMYPYKEIAFECFYHCLHLYNSLKKLDALLQISPPPKVKKWQRGLPDTDL